jgi:hypothetical protein
MIHDFLLTSKKLRVRSLKIKYSELFSLLYKLFIKKKEKVSIFLLIQKFQGNWRALSNPPLKRGDFHYRLYARFDPATGGAEKNFRAATAD